MSYDAKVFRILIASPTDVEEEREIAVKTIQEWNDLNSAERQIVLLPLRWETHTAPEYGKRPQEVINRQMVDHCDLVIGVFWTRIGSPTGMADSGTLEEIERVAGQGKPVMLYFSQVKKDPNQIDLDQFKRLREFKEKTFPKALVENFSTQIEYRDKLAKQIEIQLRNLIVSAGNSSEDGGANGTSNISLEFCDIEIGDNSGKEISLETTYFDVSGFEDVPDYKPIVPDEASNKSISRILSRTNTDYYREYVRYLTNYAMFKPVKFWLKNNGVIGARDIYIDMRITASIDDLRVESSSSFKIKKPEKDEDRSFTVSLGDMFTGDGLEVTKSGDVWDTNMEIRALQPKREVKPKQTMIVGGKSSGEVNFQVRVYADTLSEPISQELKINLNVDHVEITAKELLVDSGVLSAEEFEKIA